MKRRIRTGILCLGAALLLAACGQPGGEKSGGAWEEFLDQTNSRHQRLTVGEEIPRLTDYPYPDSLAGDCAQPAPGGEGKTVLTAREAEEDAETLFRLLHDFYGGYGYFGGDEAFGPALEQVLDSFSGRDSVSAGSLQQSLEAALGPLLRDGHFAINGSYLNSGERQRMYYVPGLWLDETQAAELDPAWLQRTIGAEGELCYCFAALSAGGEDLPERLGSYTGLRWELAEAASGIGSTVYERREENGLTILVNQLLSDAGAEDWYARMDELNDFAGSGASYGDLPVLVIDLRGNIGGQPAFARRWFEGYTGRSPSLCQSTLVRWAPELGFLEAMGAQVPERPGGYTIQEEAGAWVERQNLVFCLTDSATVSAGEWFVRWLRTMSNVVFVGSNTGGAALMSNNQICCLPHSGLAVQFGSALTLTGEGNRDGTGYLPDLWVPPADAPEAVARLCGFYGLC